MKNRDAEYNNSEVGGEWIDRIVLYMQKNRLHTFYNLVLILIILVMIPGYISVLDGTTVEVDLPPRGTVVVKNDSANKLYYELWTEHYTDETQYIETYEDDGGKVPVEFTFSLLTFNYANIEQKYGEYLKRYKPSKLIKEQHLYRKFLKNVKVKMISQKFEVEKIETEVFENGHKAQSVVRGVSTQEIASVMIEPKECIYTFAYERIGGKIYGTSLSTDCF